VPDPAGAHPAVRIQQASTYSTRLHKDDSDEEAEFARRCFGERWTGVQGRPWQELQDDDDDLEDVEEEEDEDQWMVSRRRRRRWKQEEKSKTTSKKEHNLASYRTSAPSE
jgi:hypothetical protein